MERTVCRTTIRFGSCGEDPVRPGLLYAGTEFGLFVSFDDGEHWQSLQQNLPHTPVTDLLVHRGDLVVATQGRSFYILDDLTLLRSWRELQAASTGEGPGGLLLEPRPAYLMPRSFSRGGGVEPAPAGVRMVFHLRGIEESMPVKLEVLDEAGEVVRRWLREPDSEELLESKLEVAPMTSLGAVHQVQWNLRAAGVRALEGAVFSLSTTSGPTVAPGRYLARLTVAEDVVSEQPFDVIKDPRLEDVDQSSLVERYRFAIEVRDRLSEIHHAVRGLRTLTQQLQKLEQRLERRQAPANWQELADSMSQLAEDCTALEDELIQRRNQVSQDAINFPPKIDNQYAYLYTHVIGGYTKPTQGSYERYQDLEQELAPLMTRADALLGPRLDTIEGSLRDAAVIGELLLEPSLRR